MSDPNTIAQILSALTRQPSTDSQIGLSVNETVSHNSQFSVPNGSSLNNVFNTSFQMTPLDLENIQPSSSGTLSLANVISNIKSSIPSSDVYSSYTDKLQQVYKSSKDLGYDDFRQRKEEYYDRDWKDKGTMSKAQRRRAKCSRDRSASPLRRKSLKKPKVTETVNIETNFVGLIIGRGGESLKHIEQETGARVQFYPERTSTMNHRMATISGTQAQVDIAKKRIFSVIEENKILKGLASSVKNNIDDLSKSSLENGYSSIQIYIPNKAVGMVIGRGGESIRDLQERSKTYINITHENETIHGMRPAYIFGTAESIQIARNMIDEIIKTDTVIPLEAENPLDHTLQASIGANVEKEKEIINIKQDLSTSKTDLSYPYHSNDIEQNFLKEIPDVIDKINVPDYEKTKQNIL